MNMIGFTATSRVVVAEVKTAANKADERQYQAAVAAKKADIDWTRNTIVNEESPREKRRLEAALTQKEKELAELRPPKPTAATVLADPQATLFARTVGWTPENWQIVLPIPIALLLWLAEIFSFIFAVHLMFGALADWRTATPSRQGLPGEGSGSCAQPCVVSDADDASAKSVQTVTAEATSVTKVSGLPHQVTYPNQQVRAFSSKDLPAASPSVTKVKSPKSPKSGNHHARGAEAASTQAPNGKLSQERLAQVVREDLAYGHASSSYDLARRTGWSQSAVNRLQRKLKDQPQS